MNNVRVLKLVVNEAMKLRSGYYVFLRCDLDSGDPYSYCEWPDKMENFINNLSEEEHEKWENTVCDLSEDCRMGSDYFGIKEALKTSTLEEKEFAVQKAKEWFSEYSLIFNSSNQFWAAVTVTDSEIAELVEIDSLDYNYNGHFWMVETKDGKGYDASYIYYTGDGVHGIKEIPHPSDDGEEGEISYSKIDKSLLPDELKNI